MCASMSAPDPPLCDFQYTRLVGLRRSLASSLVPCRPSLRAKLLASAGIILGSLALSSSSASTDTVTGILNIAGNPTTTNIWDPSNPLVGSGNIPLSAYTGFDNASGPTVTTNFPTPIQFGIRCGACSNFQANYKAGVGPTGLTYVAPFTNGEQAAEDIVFTTTIAGFFNNLQVTVDTFNNRDINSYCQ
jgi:hypothetical protein